MGTNVISIKSIKRETHTIDAAGKVLGRLATDVAKILMGKNKPNFVPFLDMGDFVVVTNASKVKVTGKKAQSKTYARHSGYPGGLKLEMFDRMIERKPEYVLEHAIKGMLPKNKLRKSMLKRLKVFAGEKSNE